MIFVKQDDPPAICYRSSPFYFQLRAYYYNVMSNVEDDEEAQKRGIVACAYVMGEGLKLDLEIVRKTGKLRNTLPVRFNSAHFCYNDPLMLPVLNLGMFLMGTHTRLRFRTHYGTHEECLCTMSSFGIPISALPVSPRGELNLKTHRTFMAMRRAIEAKKSKGTGPLLPARARRQPIIKDAVVIAPRPIQPNINEPPGYEEGLMGLMGFSSNSDFWPTLPCFANPWSSVVEAPNLTPMVPPKQSQRPVPSLQAHITGPSSTSASLPPATFGESPAKPHVIYDPCPNDILLGRGKPIQVRPANVRFREMIDKHMGKYDKSEKDDKIIITAYILHLVEEEGGRFLKELQDGGWVEVDMATARDKVSHAFRSQRQKCCKLLLSKSRKAPDEKYRYLPESQLHVDTAASSTFCLPN
jgi:hypothetical protein